MRSTAAVALAIGTMILVIAPPAHASDRAAEPPGVTATFEGRTINLAQGWGDAKACHSDDYSTRCYRSEAEMDEIEGAVPVDSAVAARACSGNLRLYRGTSYSGGVLSLSTQYITLNLASYGFNNDTSSYKVGPCAARFYDTNNGSGLYPGSTGANISKTSMLSGWDNRIGSVYLT